MTTKERETAKSLASTVITGRAIHEPMTVLLAEAVVQYEAAIEAAEEQPRVALVAGSEG